MTSSSMPTGRSATIAAAVLHGPRDIRLEDRPIPPPPAADELQIAPRAVTLCGSDVHYYTHFALGGDVRVHEPLILGHECAGEVVAVPPPSAARDVHVPEFKVGDRVALEVGVPCEQRDCEYCGARKPRYNLCPRLRFRSSARSVPHYQGCLQGLVNHPARFCHFLPSNAKDGQRLIGYDEAAMLEVVSVAVHAVRRAGIEVPAVAETAVSKRQPQVLITGAGPVGLLCAGVCKVRGCRVKIVDIDRETVEFGVAKGFAHQCIIKELNSDAKSDSVWQKVAAQRDAANEAKGSAKDDGFDVVFECSGAEESVQMAMYAACPGGKVVLVGMGAPVQSLPVSIITSKEVDILGTFRYTADDYREAMRLVANPESGLPNVRNLITQRYDGLGQVGEAFERLSGGLHEQGDADGTAFGQREEQSTRRLKTLIGFLNLS